jgi:hypothetical protein
VAVEEVAAVMVEMAWAMTMEEEVVEVILVVALALTLTSILTLVVVLVKIHQHVLARYANAVEEGAVPMIVMNVKEQMVEVDVEEKNEKDFEMLCSRLRSMPCYELGGMVQQVQSMHWKKGVWRTEEPYA